MVVLFSFRVLLFVSIDRLICDMIEYVVVEMNILLNILLLNIL